MPKASITPQTVFENNTIKFTATSRRRKDEFLLSYTLKSPQISRVIDPLMLFP